MQSRGQRRNPDGFLEALMEPVGGKPVRRVLDAIRPK